MQVVAPMDGFAFEINTSDILKLQTALNPRVGTAITRLGIDLCYDLQNNSSYYTSEHKGYFNFY